MKVGETEVCAAALGGVMFFGFLFGGVSVRVTGCEGTVLKVKVGDMGRDCLCCRKPENAETLSAASA